MKRRAATISISVHEESQVGVVRRAAQTAAAEAGLGQVDTGRVAIIATEMATNLVRHATGGGQVLIQSCADMRGIEIISMDRGPGIANLGRCLEDGYSSGGTAGQGLGAVRRQSDIFDVYSEPSKGTVLLTAVRKPSSVQPRIEVGAICVGKAGEDVCGDSWSLHRHAGGCTVLIADGLGHGIGAAEASRTAIDIFNDNHCGPADCLDRIHDALRATRGAAAAIAHVDPAKGLVHYSGIGNIAALIMNGAAIRNLISYNGILGHNIHKLHELSYPWPSGGTLVMHSDGLSTHWDLGRYPGVHNRHPSLVAALLHRDFSRGRDDVTVVVAREVSS